MHTGYLSIYSGAGTDISPAEGCTVDYHLPEIARETHEPTGKYKIQKFTRLKHFHDLNECTIYEIFKSS